MNPTVLHFLIAAATLLAPALLAQSRTPDEADRLYHEVGDQLFCICGCREKLLSCSHNVCSAKQAERTFLRELSQNPQVDAPAIKQQMAARFGQKVLQVPPESALYPVLGVSLVALVAAFGGMFWYVAGHKRAQSEAAQAESGASSRRTGGPKDELEQRIDREMQGLE